MRLFSLKNQALTGIAAMLALHSYSLALAADSTNQRDTQINSYNTNDKGSDDSLRNSTVYAMQALMDLAATKLPSAMKNGYNAYGKYRNSENLDHLKDQNALLANAMGSVGSGPVLTVTKTNTSFRRLDPGFLNQGEAAKVAAEFERQTGMKRADFLVQMADVSEKKIKRSDPMMIDKALSRFEGFIQKIPNAEFRKNAEKSIALVPDTLRRGMVGQAVQKLAGFFADAGSGAAPQLDASLSDLSGAKLASGSSAQSGAGGPGALSGSGDPDPSKAGAGASTDGNGDPARNPANLNGATAGGADASKPGPTRKAKGGVEGVVAAALATEGQGAANSSLESKDGEQTIFQQVTKRYRILTPQISKLPN